MKYKKLKRKPDLTKRLIYGLLKNECLKKAIGHVHDMKKINIYSEEETIDMVIATRNFLWKEKFKEI